METFAMETVLTSYRTGLMLERQATAFGACLRANVRFERVQVCHSAQAKGDKQWFVRFSPSNVARRQALLRGAQDARAARAATEPMVFAANRREVWVFSVNSGNTYRMEVDGTGCSCPDQQHTCKGMAHCKHELGWLASEERREMEETRARREAEAREFDRIFA